MNDHDDFELKRRLDALPRSIEPPGDLWPSVRARLGRRAAWRRPGLQRLAALLVLLAGATTWLAVVNHRASIWTYSFQGPRIGTLHPGGTLNSFGETASVRIGTIGTMDVTPYSTLRLLEARTTAQRVALDRGRISVKVDAPPRLFSVQTPSGTAVDLGCAYDLAVDSTGASLIRVTLGWVSFEDGGLESLIPAGMSAMTSVGSTVGTPVRDDAPDSLRRAVTLLNRNSGDTLALSLALRSARRLDAVTLWHLVGRTQSLAWRGRVADRLMALVPKPDGVTRDEIMRVNLPAMRLYWEALPGTLPITPDWQRRLWLLWLHLSG